MTKITIFQMTPNEENHFYCFRNLRFLRNNNIAIDINRYRVIYVREINDTNNIFELLESLFTEFNINHPKDFYGHSLSVSDIVKVNNEYYYCDSFGWEKININS